MNVYIEQVERLRVILPAGYKVSDIHKIEHIAASKGFERKSTATLRRHNNGKLRIIFERPLRSKRMVSMENVDDR